MSKICLIGSTRFMDQFNAANVAPTLKGHVVYSVATSTKGDFQPTADQKLVLDLVHLEKIDESDVVMVVGREEDGSVYIGESTRRELLFANMRDKEVFFWIPGKEENIGGPVDAFEKHLESAAETTVERAARRAEADAKRRKFIEEMGIDADKLEGHTGEPDCPACKAAEEGTESEAAHTH